MGLADWAPSEADEFKYDLIWHQWCVAYLTDAQLIVYLEKCSKVLKEGGFIMVKENLSTSGEDDFDELDSSVTRSVASHEIIVMSSGVNECIGRTRSLEKSLKKQG